MPRPAAVTRPLIREFPMPAGLRYGPRELAGALHDDPTEAAQRPSAGSVLHERLERFL